MNQIKSTKSINQINHETNIIKPNHSSNPIKSIINSIIKSLKSTQSNHTLCHHAPVFCSLSSTSTRTPWCLRGVVFAVCLFWAPTPPLAPNKPQPAFWQPEKRPIKKKKTKTTSFFFSFSDFATK
jgi:hypothetical protein